jgi:hypothetical protein
MVTVGALEAGGANDFDDALASVELDEAVEDLCQEKLFQNGCVLAQPAEESNNKATVARLTSEVRMCVGPCELRLTVRGLSVRALIA